MSKLWKNLRTNAMYWRFRYITRNRLRLAALLSRRNTPRMAVVPARERGTAGYVYRHSVRDTWIVLLAMVLLLTGLRVLASYYYVNPSLLSAAGALVVVGAIYWSLRHV